MDRVRAESRPPVSAPARRKVRRTFPQLKGLAALAACCAIAFLGLRMLPNQSNSSGSMTDGGAPESAFYAANAQMADSDDAASSSDGADGMDGGAPTDRAADSVFVPEKGMFTATDENNSANNAVTEDTPAPEEQDLLPQAELETDEAAVGRWLAENRPGEENPIVLSPEEAADLARWVLEEAGIDLGLPTDRQVLLTYLGPEA